MKQLFHSPIQSMNFLTLTSPHSFFKDQAARYSVSFPAGDMPTRGAWG